MASVRKARRRGKLIAAGEEAAKRAPKTDAPSALQLLLPRVGMAAVIVGGLALQASAIVVGHDPLDDPQTTGSRLEPIRTPASPASGRRGGVRLRTSVDLALLSAGVAGLERFPPRSSPSQVSRASSISLEEEDRRWPERLASTTSHHRAQRDSPDIAQGTEQPQSTKAVAGAKPQAGDQIMSGNDRRVRVATISPGLLRLRTIEPEVDLPLYRRYRPEADPERGPRVLWRKQEEAYRAGILQRISHAPHAPTDCLPPRLVRVVYEVAEKYGTVQIVSTHRSLSRNRRVGGARRSMHLECRAIDFFVRGQHKGLRAFLLSHPAVGGFKRYPTGHYHIDDGPRRTW